MQSFTPSMARSASTSRIHKRFAPFPRGLERQFIPPGLHDGRGFFQNVDSLGRRQPGISIAKQRVCRRDRLFHRRLAGLLDRGDRRAVEGRMNLVKDRIGFGAGNHQGKMSRHGRAPLFIRPNYMFPCVILTHDCNTADVTDLKLLLASTSHLISEHNMAIKNETIKTIRKLNWKRNFSFYCPDLSQIRVDVGPKGQPFVQPRATPWGTGTASIFLCFAIDRPNWPNSPCREANGWPVGPKNKFCTSPLPRALPWAGQRLPLRGEYFYADLNRAN